MALLAGLFLAVAPYPVLDSHYTNVDVPMTFWLVVSACAALIHARGRSFGWLAAAAVAIGLATATKYPALAATPMLAGACVAARREGEPLWRTLLPALPAGLIVVAVFAVCAPYSWLDFEGFRAALLEESRHMGKGHVGFDVIPEGWIYQRGVHQVAAGLPFGLGIPLYLMAIGGLAGLVRRPRAEGLVLAAGALPLFAVVCLPDVVFVRYLLPLLPFLAVSAAGFGSSMLHSPKRPLVAASVAAVLATLAYSSALTWSQLRSLEPQNGALVSQWIREQVPPGRSPSPGSTGCSISADRTTR